MTTLRITARPHRRITGGVVALALAVPWGLAGCSGEGLAERVSEKAIEQAAEGGADVDIDSDTGEVTIKTDEGTISTSGDLPEDFPDLPLVEGAVMTATSQTATDSSPAGWIVALQTEVPDTDALTEAVGLLTDAGFTVDQEVSSDSQGGIFGAQQLDDGTYTVLLSSYPGDGGAVLSYYVEQK